MWQNHSRSPNHSPQLTRSPYNKRLILSWTFWKSKRRSLRRDQSQLWHHHNRWIPPYSSMGQTRLKMIFLNRNPPRLMRARINIRNHRITHHNSRRKIHFNRTLSQILKTSVMTFLLSHPGTIRINPSQEKKTKMIQTLSFRLEMSASLHP